MEAVNFVQNAMYKVRLTKRERQGPFSGRLRMTWKKRLARKIEKMGDLDRGSGPDGEFLVAKCIGSTA